ncbi:DUF6507 family protein [Streptomyces sp. SPB162]|uniref:DUF6507 family protein n=1 Tax=Streptomyces sp. SPB162 TaxID=2940560 RepID=UPI0024051CD7|nr:DUF6507 family protein [Streptomyces sp. SPB162]MDF9814778.1 hypothetical protein [Streptomyces sp. SPB162]
MTSWDISTSGVQGVLNKAKTAAEGLAKAGTELGTILPSAAKAAGTISGPVCGEAPSGPVAAALGEFLQAREQDVIYVAVRTANSLNGAVLATNAYNQGNLQMASDAQHAAIAEPTPEMLNPDRAQGGHS